MIESIAILKCDSGFVAYMRFDDPKLNEDISGNTWFAVHEKIERSLFRKGIFK